MPQQQSRTVRFSLRRIVSSAKLTRLSQLRTSQLANTAPHATLTVPEHVKRIIFYLINVCAFFQFGALAMTIVVARDLQQSLSVGLDLIALLLALTTVVMLVAAKMYALWSSSLCISSIAIHSPNLTAAAPCALCAVGAS